VVLGSGVGGEGIDTIAKNNTGTFYTTSTTITGTMSAPQIAGGEAATVQLTTNALGNIATVTLLTAGSGYTSAPTALASPTTTGTSASFTVALTSTVTNALAVRAYIPAKNGGLDDRVADIIKQESSRRYLVQTSDGIGQCKLVAVADASLTAGQMNLIATDWNGSTYYVTKLTARRAYLTQKTMSTAYLIADGASTGWTIGASTGTIVTLSSN
jgi:hypothetical protein